MKYRVCSYLSVLFNDNATILVTNIVRKVNLDAAIITKFRMFN